MFNKLNIFSQSHTSNFQAASNANIEIKEITKLAEKIKWNERFYKSYSGGKIKVSTEKIASCKLFVALYEGKEAGYIRINNYTKTFDKFFDGEAWGVNEGYVKPTYRSNGILTALRSHVVKHHNVKVMRIETDRYLRLKDYYEEQGFIYGYAIKDGELSAICVPEFLNALLAYSKYKSEH